MHELDWLEEDIRKHCRNGTHTDYVMEKFRKFLTKKAEELAGNNRLNMFGYVTRKRAIQMILGLEIKQDSCDACDNPKKDFEHTCEDGEVAVNKNNWCEHCVIEQGKYTRYKCGNNSGLSETIFKFCPECAAPRPKEPKGLAEILAVEYYGKTHFKTEAKNIQYLADAAINWMLEKVDSMPKYKGTVFVDELKRKVKGE